MSQLLLEFIFVSMVYFYVDIDQCISKNPGLSAVAIIIMINTLIFFACCESLRRQTPRNLIVLFVFTFAESFLITVSVSLYFPEEVLMVLGLTTIICFVLIILALQTKVEFTPMFGYVLACIVALITLTIATFFFPEQFFTFLIVTVVSMIFPMYLIYDTQKMMKGNHMYLVLPKEYIFAAFNVNIFQFFLSKVV